MLLPLSLALRDQGTCQLHTTNNSLTPPHPTLRRPAATLKARLEPSSPTNSPEAEAQRDKEDSQGSSSASKGKDKDKDTRFWGQRKFVGGGARPRVVFYLK